MSVEEQDWRLPDGYGPEDFLALPVISEQLAARRADIEATYVAQGNMAGFTVAAAAALAGLLAGSDDVLAQFAVLAAGAAVLVALWARRPGGWKIPGDAASIPLSADPVEAARSLIVDTREQMNANSRRNEQRGRELMAAHALLLLATSLVLTNTLVDLITNLAT